MTTSRRIVTIEPRSPQAQEWIDDFRHRMLMGDLVEAAQRIAREENAQRLSVSFTVEIEAGREGGTIIIESDVEERTLPRIVYRGNHE